MFFRDPYYYVSTTVLNDGILIIIIIMSHSLVWYPYYYTRPRLQRYTILVYDITMLRTYITVTTLLALKS